MGQLQGIAHLVARIEGLEGCPLLWNLNLNNNFIESWELGSQVVVCVSLIDRAISGARGTHVLLFVPFVQFKFLYYFLIFSACL